MIKIQFPDGSVREYESGVTPLQVAESISTRLAQDILCASVNQVPGSNEPEWTIVELNTPITTDAAIKLHKWEDDEAKHAFWHTSSHLWPRLCRNSIPAYSSV